MSKKRTQQTSSKIEKDLIEWFDSYLSNREMKEFAKLTQFRGPIFELQLSDFDREFLASKNICCS